MSYPRSSGPGVGKPDKSGWPDLRRASLGNGSRKKSPSPLPRGTRKYALAGGGSSAHVTPGHGGIPSGGTVDGGSGVHVLFTQVSPPKQSAVDAHVPPTSPPPSGLHCVVRPTSSHFRPLAQS